MQYLVFTHQIQLDARRFAWRRASLRYLTRCSIESLDVQGTRVYSD
jgi:hypothetical protein